MRLQLRLTLSSILIMAVVVASVSAFDLIDEVTRQFDSTLKRAESLRNLANRAVTRAQERTPGETVQNRIRNDPRLSGEFLELLSESHDTVEIAVCDAKDVILNDSDPDRAGEKFTPLDNFRNLVDNTRWWNKMQVLLGGQRSYEVVDNIESDDKQVQLRIRVVIDPALIRESILPVLKTQVWISSAFIFGALGLVLVFSTIAFRPLGKLGIMLDRLAKGEFELQQAAPAAQPSDQFGVVASKVTHLGQVLKGAQSEISDLKGNVERLLDELEDAVFIFGRDRRLIAAAGAVDKFLARPRLELVGQPLTDIFPPATTLGLVLAQATQTARPVRNRRVPLHQPHGGTGKESIFIALLSVEFLEATGGGMLIRLRDPEATRQIGRQLQTADRLSAISRLTSGVAHEVKNPLNAILMHVELAKMKLNHGDYDVNSQMDVISSEILRLDRVVKTFLDFTRPVQLNLTDVDLETYLNEVVDLARPQAEGCGITVEVQHSAEPILVTIDGDLLKQALVNIVINAIEAMPEGGTLRLQSAVKVDNAEIRISDTGPGIPPEVRDKIYNLYFTTKQQGSGIGLAMTFRIVQLHDGTIDFASEPGKGTTFVIRLPVAVLAA